MSCKKHFKYTHDAHSVLLTLFSSDEMLSGWHRFSVIQTNPYKSGYVRTFFLCTVVVCLKESNDWIIGRAGREGGFEKQTREQTGFPFFSTTGFY